MFRSTLFALIFMVLAAPPSPAANADLALLEAVVAASSSVQPGLSSYLATVETPRIAEMMSSMTRDIPVGVKPPEPPAMKRFWQRDGPSLVFAAQSPLPPYVEKMTTQLSANLAVELNEMLLPAERAEQRHALVQDAVVKTSTATLADQLSYRLEITFARPVDLDEAFYVTGLRLPQKQISALTFDIDGATSTIDELAIVTADGLQLSVEVRYRQVAGGAIPERFRITSPDGKVDDLFTVTFTEVAGYTLPASMRRVIQRPDLQDDLEVFFKDYQVNQPIPADIQARLRGQ